MLTWKCASRHNGVHFFDISTAKSGPELVCFVHFDLEMCFAPQRRALFRHRNFQKCSYSRHFLHLLRGAPGSQQWHEEGQSEGFGRPFAMQNSETIETFDIDLLAVFARSVSRFLPEFDSCDVFAWQFAS